MKNLGEFKCPKCGWVHAGISEADAIAAVTDFNEYFAALSLEAQADFGGNPTTLERYTRCFRCGAPAANFLPAAPGDAPVGCTLQVVIAPNTRVLVELLETAADLSAHCLVSKADMARMNELCDRTQEGLPQLATATCKIDTGGH